MILVIDSGTTKTKTFFFNLKGKLVYGASCFTRTTHPGPGMVEQEAEEWWLAALRAVKKTRAVKRETQSAKTDAIVTSSQGGTFVPLDDNLKPLRPGITWLDNRAEAEAGTLNRRYGEKFFYYKTGHRLRGWNPLAILLWLKKNEQDVYRKTNRISFVADYLNYKMTGRFFIDQTAAGMTSFFNIKSGTWDQDLLEIAGIKKEVLPEIVPAGTGGGILSRPAAKFLGFSEGAPVVSGGHDQYCASFGSGSVKSGDCLLSCGTAWALLVCTKKLIFKLESGWASGRHLLPENFGLMGAIGNGGVVLDWVRKNLRVSRRTISPLANAKDRVKVTPYFNEGKGSVENLSLSSSPGDIYCATLKALVHQVSDYLDRIKKEVKPRQLFLVGGGIKEPFLLPMLSETTGLKVMVPDVSEAAARGAALLAIKYLEKK